MRQLALASLVLAALVSDAAANGRAPGTSTLNFRQGHESDVAAGMTFGLVISHDSGATWQWMCEKAVGYGGMYDPDYAYSSTGALFATTFNGLTVNRNGCTFDPTTFGLLFTSTEELGPDGALYVAMSDTANDHKIYKSTDDGMTFPQSAAPGQLGDWWQSLKIAASDAKRVYLFGYRFVQSPLPDGGMNKLALLFSSTDGGVTFDPMPESGCSNQPGQPQCKTLKFNDVSAIEIAGISKTNPDLVYLRVTLATGAIGDVIYRSTNGGSTWTQVLSEGDSMQAFAVRANGDLIAGTPTLGAFLSHDTGDTWTPLVNPPHMGCLVENAAGELWACTQNYGSQTIPGDGYGIMKTTDLATWTPVLKYQDITVPVSCPAGTPQQDTCEAMTWCSLVTQLGITSTAISCALPADAGTPVVAKKKSGCDAGGDMLPPAGLAIGLVIGIGFIGRRRRRGC